MNLGPNAQKPGGPQMGAIQMGMQGMPGMGAMAAMPGGMSLAGMPQGMFGMPGGMMQGGFQGMPFGMMNPNAQQQAQKKENAKDGK